MIKLKSLEKTVISCSQCGKEQKFCITGRPLSGLCTNCRKTKFKKDNPKPKKSDCFCGTCQAKIGKNNRSMLCSKCRINSKRELLTDYNKIYCKNRYKTDLLFMISKRLRSRLSHAVREFSIENRAVSSVRHLGCSMEELKIHLESKFLPGMSWSNYGEWHIDHIKPLSLAKTEQELYNFVNYENLQPLWAKDNLKKGNR
jgi:hypothetical protein